MFGRSIKLFNLLGFEVKIDFSWIIIAILIAWSLSTGLFPIRFQNLSTETYWLMGIVGAIGLFLSIIAHEFAHSVVARSYGMPMKGITLFIFGGVSEMGDEPPRPGVEFAMAIVGPVSSVIIAGIFYGISWAGSEAVPVAVNGVILYLAWINGILAAFNLVPAFPLDGGRVLRSILWKIKGNLNWATRVASRIGSGFAFLLIFLGILNILSGNVVGGIWWAILGLFIHTAAKMSYQRLVIRRALEGEKVSRFMQKDVVTVKPSLTLRELVDEFIYRYHFKMFPVVADGDKLVGCISTRELKDVSKDEWDRKKVGEIAGHCTPESTIEPENDATEALSKMSKTNASRLMVVEGENLVGIIALKDMLKFLSFKVELE
ncbi:MAG: site-2 protease family protein [Syntrophales bacterium]|jgi:Zn-dependent protease|nr:site-2 protease family protein [Syntrophales bacterium]MDY0045670.1 site-2 protease family protein [Syntrophales bacterium]